MEEQTLIPSCLIQTIAPNEDLLQCWNMLVGVDAIKQRIVAHMEAWLFPSSFLSWYSRLYPDGTIDGRRLLGRILLVGPPGVGKTLLAKGSTGYIAMKKGEIRFFELGLVRGKYVGEPAKNIEKSFDYLRYLCSKHKVTFFIDEFDTVATARTGEVNDEIKAMVNTLIRELDKTVSKNLFIIAASNFEKQIDHAAKRRFDFILRIPRPNERQRIELLSRLLQPFSIPMFVIKELANKTENYTPDDLTRAVNLATEDAFLADTFLRPEHLLNAIREIGTTGEY